jgi:hypothetical protein
MGSHRGTAGRRVSQARLDRHLRQPQTNRSASTILANPAMNLLYPVNRGPKPAEPLQDGTFRILAEPSNCIKSPPNRQDSPAKDSRLVSRLPTMRIQMTRSAFPVTYLANHKFSWNQPPRTCVSGGKRTHLRLEKLSKVCLMLSGCSSAHFSFA